MTAKQLESLVNGIHKPNLIDSEVKLLLNKEDSYINPIQRLKPVAQRKTQPVAQVKSNVVAQEVAQDTWVAQDVTKRVAQRRIKVVAQDVTKKVAQRKIKVVAQDRPQTVVQPKEKPVVKVKLQSKVLRIKDSEELLIDRDVNELKNEIFQIQGVEDRKKFVKDIGWGIMGEKRGKKYYLFGVKKISGRKYKLYIGNATN